jgi:hypothetical protein
MFKIDKNLRLVFEANEKTKVFFKPITEQVFESYYRIFALVGKEIEELDSFSTATLSFKRICKKEEVNPDELIKQFKADVMVMQEGTTAEVPLDRALKAEILSEEEWEFILSIIVFFSSRFFMTPKNHRAKTLDSLVRQGFFSTMFYTPTESQTSSPELKEENLGTKKKEWSPPC